MSRGTQGEILSPFDVAQGSVLSQVEALSDSRRMSRIDLRAIHQVNLVEALDPFVSRVKRRIDMRIVRFCRSTLSHLFMLLLCMSWSSISKGLL